ncbi:MAG TPA: SPFH domain-containing protein [Candidatus Sulfotelmatobacter sp.]|jgi:hypothetical protein|nr:SPFH domain-containing protein [Candidatus Sulfotelmatobacter sp.]
MLALQHLLIAGGLGMILVAVSILAYDSYCELLYRRALATPGMGALPPRPQWRWRTSLALALLAWGPILLALSIVVVPSGMAGIRVSETSGTVPGTLYPGVHFMTPLVEDVALFDTRDQAFTTGVCEDGKNAAANVSTRSQLLDVQAKEGRNAWAGDHGALPARSQASRLHSRQSAAPGGEGNCSADRSQRVARTDPELYGAGCFLC